MPSVGEGINLICWLRRYIYIYIGVDYSSVANFSDPNL